MSNTLLTFISLLLVFITSIRGATTDCQSLETLNTIHSCLSCSYLWELSLNKCIDTCQASLYYNKITMKCENCPEKCEQCIDGNSCQKCFGSLTYNQDQQRCVCDIEGCLQCDFKGDICRECSNGYEQDIGLKCVKSQPKLIIRPRQGMSLKTLFSFSLQDEYNQDQSGDLQQYKSFKCIIIGHNMSTQTNISLSTNSCVFNQYLPTINNLEIRIFEYITESSTGQIQLTNQYVYNENISVVSSFSSLNNLWEYIQSQIKPIDSLQLQIVTLYEYSHLTKNNCQLGNYCLNSGNICYTPSNYCICGGSSYSGMRDCSSMKSSENQFYQYLNSVYSMCIKSIKGLESNINCPQPLTYESPNGDQNYILFLLEQSNFFKDDNEFILALRNSLTKINNNYILQKIFPFIVQRLVSKQNKIFSKVDSENNLLIIYKTPDNFQIDYSVFLQGQIPIGFFQYTSDFINNQSNSTLKSNSGDFQELIFSDQIQSISNKYTEKYKQLFYYIKLFNSQKIQLSYTFENKNEFNNAQMICLQANQQKSDQLQLKPLILCNEIEYNPTQNAINCNCQGDTFLFLNDKENLYVTREDYEILINKVVPQVKAQESQINQDSILLIVLFICGLLSICVFIGFYIYCRKQQQSKQTKIPQTCMSAQKNISLQIINKSPQTNNISLKQGNFEQKNDNNGVFYIQVEEDHQKNKILKTMIENDIEYMNNPTQKDILVQQNQSSNKELILRSRLTVKNLSLKEKQTDIFGNSQVSVQEIKSIQMNQQLQENSQIKIDEISEVDQDQLIQNSKTLHKNEIKADENSINKRIEDDISMQTPELRAIMHSPQIHARFQISPNPYQQNSNQNGSPESKIVLLLDKIQEGNEQHEERHYKDTEKIKQRRAQQKNQQAKQQKQPQTTTVNKVNKLLFQDSQY